MLFLDELPEFAQNVVEVLRQPLEDKIVTISRALGSVTFPANFMLIAAMNPCPCGFYGNPVRECTCSVAAIARYQKRLSGPLLDRIDIHVEVPHVDYEKLADKRNVESSTGRIRERVQGAREKQQTRLRSAGLNCNARWVLHRCNNTVRLNPLRRNCSRLRCSNFTYPPVLFIVY